MCHSQFRKLRSIHPIYMWVLNGYILIKTEELSSRNSSKLGGCFVVARILFVFTFIAFLFALRVFLRFVST